MLVCVVERTAALDEAQRAAIVQVCNAAMQIDDADLLFSRYLPPDSLHVLGYQADQLVAHAVATTRWMQPAGLPVLRSAYIDAVAAWPAEQGRGFASAVMRRLAAEIADYEIAGLQTERVSFYTRLGWELWRGPVAGREAGEIIPLPDQHGVMILRLPQTPPLDLDGVLSIERQGARFWE